MEKRTTTVTQARFNELVNQHQEDRYILNIQGWQVPVVYSMVLTASADPRMKELSPGILLCLAFLKEQCEVIMSDWGFTQEEISDLARLD